MKEDLNSMCPTRKEKEGPAVPVHLPPELCAGCDKTPHSRAGGAVPPYSRDWGSPGPPWRNTRGNLLSAGMSHRPCTGRAGAGSPQLWDVPQTPHRQGWNWEPPALLPFRCSSIEFPALHSYQTLPASSTFPTGLEPDLLQGSPAVVPRSATTPLPSVPWPPLPGIVIAGYQKAHVAGGRRRPQDVHGPGTQGPRHVNPSSQWSHPAHLKAGQRPQTWANPASSRGFGRMPVEQPCSLPWL